MEKSAQRPRTVDGRGLQQRDGHGIEPLCHDKYRKCTECTRQDDGPKRIHDAHCVRHQIARNHRDLKGHQHQNDVQREQRPPPTKPQPGKRPCRGRAHQHLSLTADVENTALEGHRRAETGHDQRQHICQHIQKALGAAEGAGEYAPIYDQRIPPGKPYGQPEQHQRQNQRKQRQSNPCFFHSVPPCADDLSLPIRLGAEGQAGLQPRVVYLAIYAAFHTFASSIVLGTTMVPSLMAATAALYFSITSAGI